MKTAAKIALIYLGFAIVWITVSDQVVSHFVSSPEVLTQVQTYKGLAFITVNTLLLFFLVRSHIRVLESRLRVEKHLSHTQRLLLGELDHRVRNNLAELGSLLTIYRRTSESVPDLTERFERRIRGFKVAHELIAANGFELVPVEDVIRKGIESHGRAEVECKSHPGVVFKIDPLQVSPLVTALQEVAEHAGVCARAAGVRVGILADWSVVPGTGEQISFGHLSLASISLVVRGAAEGAHAGFMNSRDSGSGRALVEGLVRFNLAGEVEIGLVGADLVCRIDIPAEGLRTMDHPVMDVRNIVGELGRVPALMRIDASRQSLER